MWLASWLASWSATLRLVPARFLYPSFHFPITFLLLRKKLIKFLANAIMLTLC